MDVKACKPSKQSDLPAYIDSLNIMAGVIEGVVRAVNDFLNKIFNFIKNIWEGIVQGVTFVWGIVRDGAKSIWNFFFG